MYSSPLCQNRQCDLTLDMLSLLALSSRGVPLKLQSQNSPRGQRPELFASAGRLAWVLGLWGYFLGDHQRQCHRNQHESTRKDIALFISFVSFVSLSGSWVDRAPNLFFFPIVWPFLIGSGRFSRHHPAANIAQSSSNGGHRVRPAPDAFCASGSYTGAMPQFSLEQVRSIMDQTEKIRCFHRKRGQRHRIGFEWFWLILMVNY